jgi:hypothetical protein
MCVRVAALGDVIPGRAEGASPESIFADLWLWIPDLPLHGNPE